MKESSGAGLPCEFVIGRSERCGAKRAYRIEVERQGIDYSRSLCRTHLTAVVARSRVAGRNVRIQRAPTVTPGRNVVHRSLDTSRKRFDGNPEPLGSVMGGKRLSIYRDRLSAQARRADVARAASARRSAFF